MITVKEFLDAGFEFVIGDELNYSDGSSCTISHAVAVKNCNIPDEDNDRIINVGQLTWRANAGTQPVGDDCMVEICYGENSFDFGNAVDVDWDVNHELPVIKWRPHLPSLEKSCNKQCLNEPKPLGQMPRCEECGVTLATEMTERDLPGFDCCDVERELDESDESNKFGIRDGADYSSKVFDEYDRGMRECVQKISLHIGKTFAVDVGYEGLPDAVYEALNPVAKSDEWNGEGLPPVGFECEYIFGDLDTYIGHVAAYDGDAVWFKVKGNLYKTFIGEHIFRKILTPEQQAENSAIENLRDAIQSCEELGLPVYFGDSMVTGADKDGKSISLS